MATASARVAPERLQVAFDLVRARVADGALPVGLLAVADRSEVLRCEGFGPDGPIAADGVYLLASITKPIVATAVLQLVEQGRLLIADPVARHVPEFGANGKEGVTVWHLLTHTSGLDDSYMRQGDARPTPELDLRGACGAALKFAPGSRYEYCNPAFRVLGELVTRLSGQPYPDYLREWVFGPAGMADTSFWPEPAKQARVLPVVDLPFPGGLAGFASLATPAGGLFSTAADLVAFGQAYLNGGQGRRGRLLGPAAIRTMTRLHTGEILEGAGAEAKPAYRGLGWALARPTEGMLLSPSGYGHGGATGTHLWVDPEAGLVIVFLTNRWGLDSAVKLPILNAVLAAVE